MSDLAPASPASASLTPAALLTLSTWLSPAYPVGAFAWSHGLERAQADGDLRDGADLRDWIETALTQGAGRSDAVLLCAAWRDPDDPWPAEMAQALQPSAERRAESLGQGAAFARVTGEVRGREDAPCAYPVALGRAARREGLPLEATCAAFLQAYAANLVSAGIRLSLLGQTEGQAILHALVPLCLRLAREAQESEPEDLGGACLALDIASMLHETQYSRLFRS